MPATDTKPTEQPEQARTTESATNGATFRPDTAVDRESLQQVTNNFYAPL